LFGLPFLPLTWAGFFVPLVVENQRYDTSPLFSLRPIHATKPMQTTKGYYSKLIEGNRKPLAGDLIFSRNATVGEVAQVAEWHPPFAMGQDVCLLRKRKANYSTVYLQTVIKSTIIRKQLENLMVGSTFKRVNIEQIRTFFIPFPSHEEQSAIATALSDADALISSLEKLLTKKRNIKQGAMQRLLEPKEGWEVKRLGDCLEKVVGGGTPSRSNKEFWEGEIPWVTVKDFATFNPYVTQEYITKKGLDNSASHLIPKGVLVTPTRMGLGKAVIYNVDVSINQDLKALFPSKNLDTLYLYFWFQKNSELIEKMGSGSTVMGISLNELRNIDFLVPSLVEQTSIATILSDMDAEITALETKLEKYRKIKLGMMQNLLTGKIRLV
ncbi:MAG: restriction endonuclease subunit S, partial [Saprospiraceae bacterium]